MKKKKNRPKFHRENIKFKSSVQFREDSFRSEKEKQRRIMYHKVTDRSLTSLLSLSADVPLHIGQLAYVGPIILQCDKILSCIH